MTRTCTMRGCDKAHHGRGLCANHYGSWWARTDAGSVSAKVSNDRSRTKRLATAKGLNENRMRVANARAIKVGAVIGWAPLDTVEVLEATYGKGCSIPECHETITDVDHVTSLKRRNDADRGDHDILNMALVCQHHNIQKWTHDGVDFRPATALALLTAFHGLRMGMGTES